MYKRQLKFFHCASFTSQCGWSGHSTREARFVSIIEAMDSTTTVNFEEKRTLPTAIRFSARENLYIWSLSKIDKDSKGGAKSISFQWSNRSIGPKWLILKKNEYRHRTQRPGKPIYVSEFSSWIDKYSNSLWKIHQFAMVKSIDPTKNVDLQQKNKQRLSTQRPRKPIYPKFH